MSKTPWFTRPGLRPGAISFTLVFSSLGTFTLLTNSVGCSPTDTAAVRTEPMRAIALQTEPESASPTLDHRAELAAADAPQLDYTTPRVTRAQVIDWSNRRERDEIIIDRINQGGTVFHITTSEENRLRDAGVSEEVIRAMKATAWN